MVACSTPARATLRSLRAVRTLRLAITQVLDGLQDLLQRRRVAHAHRALGSSAFEGLHSLSAGGQQSLDQRIAAENSGAVSQDTASVVVVALS